MENSFTGTEYCSLENLSNSYSGAFHHDIGTEKLIINDSLITSAEVGEARAKSELIKNAYSEKWVNIESVYITGLKQNDFIKFKGIVYIVKEIVIKYSPPKLIMNIKGLRYD